MSFPHTRGQRLRQLDVTRKLVRETRLSADQLVMPLFVRKGKGVRAPIPSLPGQFQLSIDQLIRECEQLARLRIPGVLLFGVASSKDDKATFAYAKEGIVQQALRALKDALPELLIITDVCLCAYTSHGHCGVVTTKKFRTRSEGQGASKGLKSKITKTTHLGEREFWIDNDATLELLSRIAVSHAQAGADMVAPSDMMDGNVGSVRAALDSHGFKRTPIMAYTAKFASSMYGPFREAVDSSPEFSDRRSYQMDPANTDEAIREARLDIEQGADILMVKPALTFLDIIYRFKAELNHPVAAFNVSGEYAMVKAAAMRGWLVEQAVVNEMLLSIKRAGADVIITYWAKDAAKWLK